jgi:peptidoglycan/LPS O-acetylase OafA/YrhL
MEHDSISPPATLAQLGAHALLLHGVLGFPSISAGAWYVAIDFQLYALIVLVLWLAGRVADQGRLSWLVPFWSAIGVTLSLLHFNLYADWDNWAPYFFGSYGLGLMAWWASDPRRQPGSVLLMVVMTLLPVLAGLLVDFRSRIALALAVACVLFLCGRIKTTSRGRAWSAVNGLARTSYSVFLIHFPVCLLVNAAFTRFVPATPVLQAFGMLIAWAASLAAGALFFHWVELPLGRVFGPAAARIAVRPSSA